MFQATLHGIVTFVELTALSILAGAALCLLWTASPKNDEDTLPFFAGSCRRLLMLCLIALVISSFGNLMQRTIEMSGLGFTEALPLIPVVLFKTHYGSIGLVRSAGLGLALVVWFFGRRRMHSRGYGVLMLCAAAAIAFSRSATSHAADFGDLSLQELSDWFHLLAASCWAGALFAIAVTVSPSGVADNNERQRSSAAVADRFYVFFGPVFAVLTATGLYNAWVDVGSFEVLLTTTYGRVLSIKLALFAYLTWRYIVPPQHGKDEAAFAMQFLRRTRVEALLVLAILISVSILTHGVPARHAAMMQGNQQNMQPGQQMGPMQQMGPDNHGDQGMSHHMQHGHGM